ncbi:MAG: hypothetical protein V3R77_00170 [Candidatus Binatia bacterium]
MDVRRCDGSVAPVLAAALLATVVLPVCGAQAAKLEGWVKAGPGVAAAPALSVAVDDWVCGKDGSTPDPRLVIAADRRIADVVVTVEVEGAAPSEGAKRAVITQEGCRFQPHVSIVVPGQELEVRNDDSVLHNFRTIATHNRRINRAQVKGTSDVFRFETPEIIRVECDVHYWMSAVVVVAEHEFVAVTDANGGFSLEGLDPGRYPVRLWHQRLGERRTEVEIAADGGRLEVVWPAAPQPPVEQAEPTRP